ncbi:MAG: diguanylate cyclase [Candidatus Omnitrophica bacterium]|nr:diguanylate cyclase [Candidatus Omnitrophota bacterium]HOX55096.1 diguanylate cyclase [Candidatus Omnitrophota bacterium]
MPDIEDRAPEKRVEQLVFRDELTNAFNRRYLFQYLPSEISNFKGTGKDIWLFMIDIDDFKTINDKYGHLAGDDILKGVVEILGRCVRGGDTVIRYAGDEFTVILPGGELSNALAVAGRITKSVSENKFKTSSGQIISNVNLSIGVANFPDDAPDALRLIDLADKALYVSKQKGKNRISLTSDISTEVLREKEILERFPCPSLIERQNQLSHLKDLLSATAQNKKTKIVAITGEAGIGKSRLLDEFIKFLSSNKSAYFYSACLEQHINQPYSCCVASIQGFLLNLKERKLTINKEDFLKDLSNQQLFLLTRLIPALGDIVQEDYSLSQELAEQKTEEQIKNSLIQLCSNIASKSPLTIILDDFYFIDKQSLGVILSLKEQNSAIMICVAFRDKDAIDSALAEYPFVSEFSNVKNSLSEEISLSGLSENGTSQMMHTILVNIELTSGLGNLIYKISMGNPLFVEELLKFLIQKGFIYLKKGQWGKIEINESDIPHSLIEVIQERIKAMDTAAQEIISKAAVIGQDFNVNLLHQMGKENEGYILDILESAKKAGIIRQKVSESGDEMSFVSGEIRKVLYDLIEQDKLKNLHQQVGEIQEGIHSGDINKIAGELYFHFKKAEDYHRATQYAKRIKESDKAIIGRAIDYAKEILEETETKKVEQLSSKSLELLPDIIRLLYLVNINFSLYPKASQMLQSPIDQIYQKLTEVFARDEVIVFSEVKDELVVNGKLFGSQILKKSFKDAFLSILKAHHIETLSLKKGLTKKELVAFIEILNTISETASLSDELKAKEINNIIINEISFEIASKGKRSQQREKLEEVMLVDYLMGKISTSGKEDFLEKLANNPSEIADALSKMSDMIAKEGKGPLDKKEAQADVVIKSVQKIANQIIQKDPQEWDKQKKNLANTILNLEPQLRKDVLFSGSQSTASGKDIIKELIPEFPDEVVLDLLADEFSEAKASATKMRMLIQRFLINPNQKKRLLPLLKDKFSRAGMPKEDVAWAIGEKNWQDLPLEERVEKLSKMSAKDFLGLEREIDVYSLMQEAFKQNKEDLLKKILNTWREFLRDKSPEVKSRISSIFDSMIDLIPSAKEEALINLVDFLFDEFRNEKDLDVYVQLVTHLTNPSLVLIDNKSFYAAKKIINKLNKENLRPNLPEKQKRCLQDAIDKITDPSRLKSIVAELIKKVDENAYYDDVVEFILEFENLQIVKLLIEEAMIEDKVLSSLGYFAAFLRRRAIGGMLSKLMKTKIKEAVYLELLDKISDARLYIVRNAIELIVFINDPLLVKSMEKLLSHEDANIRSRAVFALGKIGGTESVQLVAKALRDKDNSIRMKAVKILGKIGDVSILETLRSYISDKIIGKDTDDAIKEIENRIREKKEI